MTKPPRSCPHPMTDVPDAIRIVLQETARLLLTHPRPTERISLTDADGTLDSLWNAQLAEAIFMEEPGYPPYRASVMDGYAIRVADYAASKNAAASKTTVETDDWTHSIISKVYAGDDSVGTDDDDNQQLQQDLATLLPAFYITTGAVVPNSFDCVVPIEECTVDDNHQRLQLKPSAVIKKDQWIRPVGSDIPAGSVVLEQGHVLDAVALGLLLQSGCHDVCIRRPVSVGVLSTGNELLQSNSRTATHSSKGLIPDVNRPILLALLKSYGNCRCIDLGMARDDDMDGMAKLLELHLEHCEVIVTTGGVSMGETDIVEDVLVNKLGGSLHFGRLNMKPGKPTTFVSIPSKFGTRLAFAMPGNPVSGTVCTQLLVRPCLDLLYSSVTVSSDSGRNSRPDKEIRLMVDNARIHPEIQATLTHDISLDTSRPEYHRVMMEVAPNGSYKVQSTGKQQSSRLLSMRDAVGLLVLPKATTEKPKALAGEIYAVLLLRDLQLLPRTRLADSRHLNADCARTFRVGVVKVDDDKDPSVDALLERRIVEALSGSKSGSVSVSSSRVFSGGDLYAILADQENVDIHVVVSSMYQGPYLSSHLALANELRTKLSKVADAMALQARKGAAAQDPSAALFEVVVGYIPERGGSLVVFLPERGLESGLGNVRGLLKHALEVARKVER